MLLKSHISIIDSWADSKPTTFVKEFLYITAGALFIALCAQVYIPLSFTPVPITLQTYAVLTLSTLTGFRAPLSVLMYLALGFLGFPVLSEGKSGMEYMFGATGGYLVGFLVSSVVVSYLIQKNWDKFVFKSFLTFSIGQLLIFVPGLLWLGQFVGYENVLALGFYPFIPGGIIKTLLGMTTSVLVWKWIAYLKGQK